MTLLSQEWGWMMVGSSGDYWSDHHVDQTWYKLSISSWASIVDGLLLHFNLQVHLYFNLCEGGMVKLCASSNILQRSWDAGHLKRMWLKDVKHWQYSHTGWSSSVYLYWTTWFRYFHKKDTAASFGMLLAILHTSEFHGGLSGLCGKASCEMNAVVMILTGVWENEYCSYGLERIAQLHFSGKLPNE